VVCTISNADRVVRVAVPVALILVFVPAREDGLRTAIAVESGSTVADVGVDTADADTVVVAGLRSAFVRINLAVVTLKPSHTSTGVGSDLVGARAAVEAGDFPTFVDLLVTVDPGPPRFADAAVGVHAVNTS